MATTTLTEAEKLERLRALLKDFNTAMLVTRTEDGSLRSRPLAIADTAKDGGLYFATSVTSPKVRELDDDAHVNVTMQDKHKFVSVTGRASISQERALIDRLWSEAWRVWFPKGKDDPSLCIVKVNPSEAAYWDMSGTGGVQYLFEMAKAFVTGTKVESDDDERHVAHLKT